MKLSVAYTFEPGIIKRLAAFSQVREVYGKLDKDLVGGGRSTYTLRPTSWRKLSKAVDEAHRHSIVFNYLLNAATLGGLEQSRAGQRALRRFLDKLSELNITLPSPVAPVATSEKLMLCCCSIKTMSSAYRNGSRSTIPTYLP